MWTGRSSKSTICDLCPSASPCSWWSPGFLLWASQAWGTYVPPRTTASFSHAPPAWPAIFSPSVPAAHAPTCCPAQRSHPLHLPSEHSRSFPSFPISFFVLYHPRWALLVFIFTAPVLFSCILMVINHFKDYWLDFFASTRCKFQKFRDLHIRIYHCVPAA